MNVDRLDQLLARIRAGDETAYRQFLAKAADRLRADLRRQVPGESDLEDIVQQCLIAVHRKRHTIDPRRPVTPWLRAIGQYKLIDHGRKRGRSLLRFFDVGAAVAPFPLAGSDAGQLLSHLPAPQTDAVRLVQLGDLNGAEARAGTGLSAMKRRVHRRIKRLKALVGERAT